MTHQAGKPAADQPTAIVVECELHWLEWLLISFAFLALGSMILHTMVYAGM